MKLKNWVRQAVDKVPYYHHQSSVLKSVLSSIAKWQRR